MKKILILWFTVVGFWACQKKTLPPEPIGPLPSPAQLAWHQMELNAFVHFTTNTFTGKEWGYGDEDPVIFNPSALNTDQWAETFAQCGFKGVILTCKHHDGFCLWPSQYTDHSVKSSPWLDGQGDVVKMLAASCAKYGLKFGVYLSPWDRNYADYGQPAYVDYYRKQLEELFTNYGPVFEMWFDGANGGDGYYGGTREIRQVDRRTYYDWPKTIELVRGWNPEVIFFSDAGPSIRWCGNEKGFAGETNWCTMSIDTLYPGQADITALLNRGAEDGQNWVPAEVDVSIRPGWFYHAEEDTAVKSPEKLFEIFLSSVGRGSNLLLNVPPDRRGLLHENDVAALKGWRKLLDEAFSSDLAKSALVSAPAWRGKDMVYGPGNVNDGNPNTYWATDDGQVAGELILDLGSEKTLHYIQLQEHIPLGQRVKAFTVSIKKGEQWDKVAEGTTIGYKRILPLGGIQASEIKVNILEAKACPLISEISIF